MTLFKLNCIEVSNQIMLCVLHLKAEDLFTIFIVKSTVIALFMILCVSGFVCSRHETNWNSCCDIYSGSWSRWTMGNSHWYDLTDLNVLCYHLLLQLHITYLTKRSHNYLWWLYTCSCLLIWETVYTFYLHVLWSIHIGNSGFGGRREGRW